METVKQELGQRKLANATHSSSTLHSEADHREIKLKDFTQHDKIRVIEEFFSNEDVQVFLYETLFPNAKQV